MGTTWEPSGGLRRIAWVLPENQPFVARGPNPPEHEPSLRRTTRGHISTLGLCRSKRRIRPIAVSFAIRARNSKRGTPG
jgi:hypothetical protein